MQMQFEYKFEFATNGREWLLLRVYLDHGLSEDLDERFAFEPRRGETGWYYTDDPAPKLGGSGVFKVDVGPECHRNRGPDHHAVDDPCFGRAWRFRGRRRWRWRSTDRHWVLVSGEREREGVRSVQLEQDLWCNCFFLLSFPSFLITTVFYRLFGTTFLFYTSILTIFRCPLRNY